MLKLDGLDDAVIGIASRCGEPDLIAYSEEKIIEEYVKQGMSHEEAIDFLGFNVTGAWMGEGTPLVVRDCTMEEIECYIRDQELLDLLGQKYRGCSGYSAGNSGL